MRKFVYLFLLLFIFLPHAVMAEKIEGKVKEIGVSVIKPQSGNETVGMSFYKIAKKAPNLRDWATKTKAAQDAPIYDQDIVTTAEFNRLQNKFANFDAAEPIIVHAEIDLNRYSDRQETLFLPYFYKNLYFPYNVYDEPIAILAKDIERFKEIHIPGRDAEHMYKKLKDQAKGLVELTLVPILADSEQTLRLDETEFYPLLVDVVQFTIWSTNGAQSVPLWVWRKDGYRAEDNQEILDLFNQ